MRTVKYIYDDIEEALIGSSDIILLYKLEKVYVEHTIFVTRNKRYLIVFKIQGEDYGSIR